MKQLDSVVLKQGSLSLPTPRLAHILFKTRSFAWLWLGLRLYLGVQWFQAGWSKVGEAAWVESGVALKGFWTSAIAVPASGRPPIAYGWYRDFIAWMLDNGHYSWFAKLVAYGELLVGVALILGAFVGIAAFFGAFMNWNYIMAGSASTNAMLLAIAVLLILAWRFAGWFGLDRLLLPRLATLLAGAPARPTATAQRPDPEPLALEDSPAG